MKVFNVDHIICFESCLPYRTIVQATGGFANNPGYFSVSTIDGGRYEIGKMDRFVSCNSNAMLTEINAELVKYFQAREALRG